MIKHTPGPWNREALYRLLRFSRKNDGPWDDPELWENEDCFFMPDENDADLIAFAPVLAAACAKFKAQNAELLEALQHAVEALDSDDLDIQLRAALASRAVIAKAKGETK